MQFTQHHATVTVDAHEVLGAGDEQVQRARAMSFFCAETIHQRETRTQRRARDVCGDVRAIELSRVVQERQEQMKQELGVGFSSHVAVEKLRQ